MEIIVDSFRRCVSKSIYFLLVAIACMHVVQSSSLAGLCWDDVWGGIVGWHVCANYF